MKHYSRIRLTAMSQVKYSNQMSHSAKFMSIYDFLDACVSAASVVHAIAEP